MSIISCKSPAYCPEDMVEGTIRVTVVIEKPELEYRPIDIQICVVDEARCRVCLDVRPKEI